MTTIYLLLGALLFLVTALDIIKTTFSSNGGGKITNGVSKVVWHLFLYATGHNGKSKVLEYAGPTILVSTLVTWITGLWLGLFLVLLYDVDSVVNSTTLAAADALEKLYYAGFTLSTLGIGDYKASGDLWRIVTGVAAFTGLVFITASITYFVPVLSAVGLQSKLSLYISSMGETPQQMIANSWNGEDFSLYAERTTTISDMLMQHTLNHHSYPVIHYFHNSQKKLAIGLTVVKLDLAHQLMTHVISEEVRLRKIQLDLLQTALDTYLETIGGGSMLSTSSDKTVVNLNVQSLAQKGIPLVGQNEVEQALPNSLKERSKLLAQLLEMDGWSLEDIHKDYTI